MTYATKGDELRSRQRLEAFWAGSSLGRPALNVLAKNPDFVEEEWTGPPPPGATLLERDLDIEAQRRRIRLDSRRFLYLAESMPGHHLRWGSLLTTLAVLAGGDYEYHDTAWIKEMPDILDRPLPRFDPACRIAGILDECYAVLREAVGNDGFITPPLMMDGLTTLAMFRLPGRLCVDMLDRPDWVKAWSGALTTMYIEIYERYYRRLGYGQSLCFFGPWAPGRSEGVQCDFGVNISPAMYEEFALGDLRRMTDYFDYSLYHLDGTCQMRFLDLLRQCPKLTGIQWNPETTARDPLKWLDAFGEIRRRKFCLMMSCSPQEALALTRELGPDGLFFMLPPFETLDAAQDFLRTMDKAI